LTISGKALTRHNFTLFTNYDLTTTSRNNFQQDVKIKELIAIVIASLFPYSKLIVR